MRYCRNAIILTLLFALSTVARAQLGQEWKCILYGDTRNNRIAHKEVLASMKKYTPDYTFIINVGDVVDHGYTESEWIDWQTSCNFALGGLGQNSAPPEYMACPGNHDQLSNPAGLANWEKYLPAQHKLYGNHGMFFTFDYRDARFVILDSEFSQRDGPQFQMLIESLKSNPRKWLIAVWHKPLFSFGEKSYQDELNRLWGTQLYQAGCDLVANGDAHYYVRSRKLGLNGDKYPPIDSVTGVTMIVTGNGGAPIDVPNPTYDGNGYMIAQYARTDQDYGYSELHFRDSALTLRHIFRNGTVFDQVVFRPNPKLYTPTSVILEEGAHATQAEQNYPNPFNSWTRIQFTISNPRLPHEAQRGRRLDSLSGQGQLTIVRVYDVLGREVSTLMNEVREPGTYTVQFDASDFPSGVYFYRLSAGEFVQTRKIMLIR